MAVPKFDNGATNRIVLPPVGGEGQRSRHVFSGTQPVGPAPAGAVTFDPETFSPIVAIAASTDEKGRAQNGQTVFINDALDRVAFTLDGYDAGGNAYPLIIDWEVRGSNGCIPGRIVRGQLVLSGPGLQGQIVDVSNFLCTQFELWMRVDNPAGAAVTAEIRVQAIVDRIGGQFAAVSDFTLTPGGLTLLAYVAK